MRQKYALLFTLGGLGFVLLALGIHRNVWWTITGGISALAALAWITTEPTA